MGEVPYLYYIASEAITNKHLVAFFENHLAKYKVPKQFKRVTSLPYTSTGKLQRNHL